MLVQVEGMFVAIFSVFKPTFVQILAQTHCRPEGNLASHSISSPSLTAPSTLEPRDAVAIAVWILLPPPGVGLRTPAWVSWHRNYLRLTRGMDLRTSAWVSKDRKYPCLTRGSTFVQLDLGHLDSSVASTDLSTRRCCFKVEKVQVQHTYLGPEVLDVCFNHIADEGRAIVESTLEHPISGISDMGSIQRVHVERRRERFIHRVNVALLQLHPTHRKSCSTGKSLLRLAGMNSYRKQRAQVQQTYAPAIHPRRLHVIVAVATQANPSARRFEGLTPHLQGFTTRSSVLTICELHIVPTATEWGGMRRQQGGNEGTARHVGCKQDNVAAGVLGIVSTGDGLREQGGVGLDC
ncbi:hypothetical protein C8R46DRAFT_1192513 [Mycena filopes]|nr:hypothetical protein C8R46DRAFT_1192513 [Mycena filopes]